MRSNDGIAADGNYHHVVATKNGPNTAKIYIDGVEDSGPVSGVQVIQHTAFPLQFGSNGTTPATYDEFVVLDRAMWSRHAPARDDEVRRTAGATPAVRSSD